MIQIVGYIMEAPPPRVILDGKNRIDVKEFLFSYDNVVMRRKSGNENTVTPFAYLGKDERSTYRSKIISGWLRKEQGRNYSETCP